MANPVILLHELGIYSEFIYCRVNGLLEQLSVFVQFHSMFQLFLLSNIALLIPSLYFVAGFKVRFRLSANGISQLMDRIAPNKALVRGGYFIASATMLSFSLIHIFPMICIRRRTELFMFASGILVINSPPFYKNFHDDEQPARTDCDIKNKWPHYS